MTHRTVSALASTLGITVLLLARCALAAPIFSVDLDPATPGIQSVLSVTTGTTFTVDVLLADDGAAPSPTVFDSAILELSFNDSGAVLGPGPTGPVAGALAGNSFFTFSAFGPLGPLIPGTTGLGTGPSGPAPGFASGSGAIGLIDPFLFTLPAGPPITFFSFDFTAAAAGTSSIHAAGTPAGSPELALGGAPIPALTMPGVVTVTAAQPVTAWLLAAGLLGMGVSRRRRVAVA